MLMSGERQAYRLRKARKDSQLPITGHVRTTRKSQNWNIPSFLHEANTINIIFTKGEKKHSPSQLQLPTSNTHTQILIQGRSKGNKLQLLPIPEQPLRRLVKLARNVFHGVWGAVFRVFQFLCSQLKIQNLKDNEREKKKLPSKNSRARRLTNTDPAKIPVVWLG
jgi:hypothetical protein